MLRKVIQYVQLEDKMQICSDRKLFRPAVSLGVNNLWRSEGRSRR